jgi:hypothetical protein
VELVNGLAQTNPSKVLSEFLELNTRYAKKNENSYSTQPLEEKEG